MAPTRSRGKRLHKNTTFCKLFSVNNLFAAGDERIFNQKNAHKNKNIVFHWFPTRDYVRQSNGKDPRFTNTIIHEQAQENWRRGSRMRACASVGNTTGTKCGGDPYSPIASADVTGSMMVCGSEITGVVQDRSWDYEARGENRTRSPLKYKSK